MSMLFSFMTGVLLTAVIFPRFNGCPDAAVIAEAAVKNCPACPSSSCPICRFSCRECSCTAAESRCAASAVAVAADL